MTPRHYAPLVLMLAVFLALFTFVTMVFANPFYSGIKARTATATTTVTYMTPGTATTTPVYDSYEVNGTNQVNGGTIALPNSVAVLLRGRASTTATALSVACEFSEDNVDWYQNELIGATSTNAGVQNIGVPNSFTFTYASSTVGGAGLNGTNDVIQKTFECPVPLRYVRAVITNSGANASIWAAIVPKRQKP